MYQVGAVSYQVWMKELERKSGFFEGASDLDDSRYPDYNWTIRGDVDQKFGRGFSAKVQQALLDMNDQTLLDSFPRKSFIAADNTMFQPILDTARKVGIIRK